MTPAPYNKPKAAMVTPEVVEPVSTTATTPKATTPEVIEPAPTTKSVQNEITLSEKAKVDFASAELKQMNPSEIKFSQKDVKAETTDGMPVSELSDSMNASGWNGDPLHLIELPDGTFVSLDNRRLVAAQNAGLKEVPVGIQKTTDPLPADWISSRRFELTENIYQLSDGTFVSGGKDGTLVYAKGKVATTFGEAAMFRAVKQRNLLREDPLYPGRFPINGRYEQPVIKDPKRQ
jgi:hypothetical protein